MPLREGLAAWFQEKRTAKASPRAASLAAGLGVAAMALILLSEVWPAPAKAEPAPAGQDTAAYQAALEERLEELIRQVEGAGETAVLVTLESGEERVYALDTQTGRDQTQQTHVLLDDGTALEQTVCPPTVCGVAVVCDGGGQVSVQARITSLLSALLDVPANRICVEQRRGQPGI